MNYLSILPQSRGLFMNSLSVHQWPRKPFIQVSVCPVMAKEDLYELSACPEFPPTSSPQLPLFLCITFAASYLSLVHPLCEVDVWICHGTSSLELIVGGSTVSASSLQDQDSTFALQLSSSLAPGSLISTVPTSSAGLIHPYGSALVSHSPV